MKLILYLLRWQASSIVLAPVIAIVAALFTPNVDWNTVAWFGTLTSWVGAITANLLGGLLFYGVDKFIFTSSAVEVWNFKDYGICDQCGEEESLWRLVRAQNYNKSNSVPVFLCMKCSKKKTDELRARGIKIQGKSQ